MTKLEKIVKEAKAIRKAYPKKYAKWQDYIKAASKKISGLDSVKRSGSKTTVSYSRKVATKKTAPKTTQAKLFGAKIHKDTRSHNVNVRVVSGVKPTKAQVENWNKIKSFASTVSTLGALRTDGTKRGRSLWVENSARCAKLIDQIDPSLLVDYNQKKYLKDAITQYNYWKP
jgi:hypothetical protein